MLSSLFGQSLRLGKIQSSAVRSIISRYPRKSHIRQFYVDVVQTREIVRPFLSRPISSQSKALSAEEEEDHHSVNRPSLTSLENKFAGFEKKCQLIEAVPEDSYIKLFDNFAHTVKSLSDSNKLTQDVKTDLSILASNLLRSSGKLMVGVDERIREKHAGVLWTFLKGNSIPLDVSHYNILLRTMNENNTQFDPDKILAEMKQVGIQPDRVTYQRLIHQCCQRGDIEAATKLLEEMKQLELELSEQIFASLILGYGKQANPPKISEMFELMKTNGLEPTGKSYAAALISLCRLAHSGQADATDQLKSLIKEIQTNEVLFSLDDAIDIFMELSSLPRNDAIEETIKFLGELTSGLRIKKRYMRTLLNHGFHELASQNFWKVRPSAKAIEAGYAGSIYIKELASSKAPPDFCVEECSKLLQLTYNPKAFHHLYFFSADVGNIEVTKAALKKIGESTRLHAFYYWPLIAQSKSEDDLLDVLKNHLKPTMSSRDLIETFADWVWPRLDQDPVKAFKFLESLNYKQGIIITSYLNYAVKNDKVDEAVKFMLDNSVELTDSLPSQDAEDDNNESAEGTRFSRGLNRSRPSLTGSLLNEIANETKDPSAVQRAFNLCRIPGRLINSHEVKPLIQVHIINGDYKTAIDEYVKVAKEYNVTPLKGSIIKYCLDNKDPENLQRVIDATAEVHGQTNALYDLAVSCIQCNKIKQAQKILSSPGLRVNPSRHYGTCRSLAAKGDVESLEKFIELSANLAGIDHEQMHLMLIAFYRRQKMGKRALNFWNKMQEEEFQPSKKVLSMLAMVLGDNEIRVPFPKPNLSRIELDQVRSELARSSPTINPRRSEDSS